MGDARPTDHDITQEQQAALLRRTDNGPTEEAEEELLAAEFGETDESGVYGAPAGEDTES